MEGTNNGPQAIRTEKPRKHSRRDALKGGAAVLATAAGAALLQSRNQPQSSENQPAPVSKPSENPVQPKAEVENREKKSKELLNQILAIKLGDPQRKNLEKNYVNWASNLGEIDLGLMSVVDSSARIELLDKRYALRHIENATHRALSADQINWAESEGIHPETLAISLEAREIALRILPQVIKAKGLPNFRGDMVEKIRRGDFGPEALENLQNPELMLLTAGGMARLIVTETGSEKLGSTSMVEKVTGKLMGRLRYGLANIGKKPAMEMTVDTEAFPKVANDKAIEFLAQILSNSTELQFHPETIPGSEKGEGSVTGGALGIQIMPERAKAMYENLKSYFTEHDPLPHPLDPIGSTVLAYIFLAQGSFSKEGFQPGYYHPPLIQKGIDISNAFNTEAVKTWNPHSKQAYEIISSDLSYLKQGISNKI